MVDFKDYTYKMDRTLEVLQEDFGAVRAGRANARVLDRISVEYYGVDTPIGQVGTIASPDARTLVIQPWDGSLLKKIEMHCKYCCKSPVHSHGIHWCTEMQLPPGFRPLPLSGTLAREELLNYGSDL